MTTTYFIAGALFFIGYIAYIFVKNRQEKDKHFEEAIGDAQKAVDEHDTDALFDSLRRLRKNR